MGLNLSDSAVAFDELKNHVGHKIVCVGYADKAEYRNVAVECETCGAVLIDFDQVDRDEKGNCIYCGQKCWIGDMCDEQQAGGF